MKRSRLLVQAMICVVLAVLLNGCFFKKSGESAILVKPGFFFGHDLRQEKTVVYVLDLSGSMSATSGGVIEKKGVNIAAKAAGSLVGGMLGDSVGDATESRIKELRKKIEKVKLHLIASLQGLPEEAKFNIVLFSNQARRLSPVMIPAHTAAKVLVGAFVYKLEEGGSTNMYKAMETAIAEGSEHIILLTDGLPTSSSPQAILDLLRQSHANGSFRVSTVGVGDDQARDFLSQMAQENKGSFKMYF